MCNFNSHIKIATNHLPKSFSSFKSSYQTLYFDAPNSFIEEPSISTSISCDNFTQSKSFINMTTHYCGLIITT